MRSAKALYCFNEHLRTKGLAMKKRIVLSLIATTSLVAGETSLEPVIISATKTQTTLWDAPASASVVSKETLAQLPITHIKEVLKGLEGVTSIAHRGASDVNPTVVLRGIPDQSRTMILLDGIPMNTSYTSTASTPYTILPEELEHIEVIRGPFSSLYGSSAMGGSYQLYHPNAQYTSIQGEYWLWQCVHARGSAIQSNQTLCIRCG